MSIIVTATTRKAAGLIVQRLKDAGISPWSSHQFGIVDMEKLTTIIETVLGLFDISPRIPQWQKDKRGGKPDAFVK